MSWVSRNSRTLVNLVKQFNYNHLPVRSFIIQHSKTSSKLFCYTSSQHTLLSKTNLDIYRYKHNKKNQKQDVSESDDEPEVDDWDNEVVDKQTKIMNVKLNSLRADLVLKAGLGIARNKIETMFYESKIRVNGRKLLKKSAMLNVGDEIDIIKGPCATNPDFLSVARVEILSTSERSEGLNVKLRRNKSLTIENYDS